MKSALVGKERARKGEGERREDKGNTVNVVLFIAFITSCSCYATRYKNISFSYMELSKLICHTSQSIIVTTGIFCPHLKPLYFRLQ